MTNRINAAISGARNKKRTPLCKAGFEVEGRGAHGDEVRPVRGYNYPTSPSQAVTHITSAKTASKEPQGSTCSSPATGAFLLDQTPAAPSSARLSESNRSAALPPIDALE